MKKNKRYTYSDEMMRRLLSQRDQDIDQVAENIIVKQYEDELKKEFPGAKLSELKQQAVKKHKQEYDDVRNRIIAPLYHEKASDIIKFSNDSVILTNSKSYAKVPAFAKNTKLPDIYDQMNLKKNLFEVIEKHGTSFNNTNKVQTGSQLVSNVIAFDKLNYSYTTVKASQTLESANKAYDFFKKAKKVMAYDYETMGGTDEFGYKKVDALTEFAYNIYDKETGTSKAVNTIVGLDATNEKRFRELIQNVNKEGVSSNEQDVIYRRIGLYGHKDTKFIKDKEGMYVVDKMADLENGHRFSDADIERGFKRLRDIYEDQNKLGTSPGGLHKWQQRYAEMIGHMNDKDMAVLDYNGIIADRPWQNKFLATMGLNDTQKAEFMKTAGINDMFLDTTSDRFYDVRVHTRYAANNVGSEAYYSTPEAKKRLNGKTPFSQEGITRTLFEEDYTKAGGGAHTAGFDTQLLTKLAVDKTGFGMNGETFVDRIYRDANASKSNINSALRTGNLDLLMANQSVQYFGGGSGPLSYVYDPVNKIYRTANQYAIGDKVAEEFTKENPVKRGRLYTLDFAGQIDMTEDWVKNIDGLHDEYAQKSLYAVKLNPFFDEKVAGSHQGLRGHSVMFFNSKEQMESTLSNMTKIGERDKVTTPFRFLSGKAGEEVKEMLTTHNVVNGKLLKGESPTSIDDVIRKATYADVNDTAARMIREDSYSKAMNFSRLYDKLNDFNGAPVDKRQAHQIMLDLMQSQDRKLSRTVAAGKTLELSYKEVQEALGYTLDNGKSFNLISNTLNNQMTAFDYMASQNKVFEAVKNHFYEKDYSSDQLQFKFENILNTLTEQEISNINKDPNRSKTFWQNSKPAEVFGKDLNYFNFDTRDFFNEKAESSIMSYTKPMIDEDILRIDLGPGKEYNFVNNLLRRTRNNYNDMTPFQKKDEGITQLRNFVNKVKEDKSYGNLFEQFDEEKISGYKSPDMFASSIIQELRDYRTTNPTAGYLSEAYTQDATIRNKILDSIAKDKNIYSRIAEIDKNLPTYVVTKGDKELLRSHAQTIVNNILVDDIDPFAYAKEYGLSDTKGKYLSKLYGKAKEEYTDFMTDFLDAFTMGTDVGFQYSTKQKTFSLMNGSQKAIPIELPRLRAMDGNFFVDMGSSKVALHAKVDAKAAILRGSYQGAKDINVITTLGAAFNDTSSQLGFYKVAKRGDMNNDILRRTQSLLQNVKKGIRSGASVDFNDILDIQTPYRVDIKDVMGLAPLLKQNKLLEGRTWRDADFVSQLKVGTTFEKSSDAYRELFQKNIPEMLRVIAEQKEGFNDESWMGLIAKNMSFLGKETQGADFIGMIEGISHRPGVELNNNMRPVINQSRSVLYRTEDWKKTLQETEFKNRNIGLKPITTSESAKHILNRELEGIGKTSVELQVGKLNISEMQYRSAITDHFVRKSNKTLRDDKIFNKLKSVNLTEQEQVIDPRVATKFFDRMQEQKINSRKQLSFYMDINQNTIEAVNELKQMQPKIELNTDTGKVEFKYGKGVYKNRHDKLLDIEGYSSNYTQLSKVSGKFNEGYFSKTDGMLIKEDKINEMISGLKTKEEAAALLEETFDKAWYVKPNDHVSYKKMLNGFVEKGMANSLAFGLGEGDEKVHKYLSQTNKDLLGHVAIDEIIEDKILDKFDSKIGNQVGIKSREELKDLIYKERYEPFDTLRNIFGKEHDFALMANHSQGSHKNTQLGFEELTGTMKYHLMKQDSSLSENDAMQKVFNDLTDADHKFINIQGTDGTGVTLEDGVIHFPNHLKGGEDYYDNAALEKILAKDEYKDMAHGLKVKYKDKEVGSFVMTGLSEARDSQWISGKAPDEYIESFIDIQNKIDTATGREKQRLEGQLQSYKSSLNWNTKGQKITDREIQMLELQRYDEDLVSLMQNNLDKKTFESSMGHVLKKDDKGAFVKENGNYVLDEASKGRAMLSEMTDSYKQVFLKGHKDAIRFDASDADLEGTLKAHYLDDSVRGGINQLVNTQGVLSKDRVEHLYSTSRGVKAVRFNNAQSYSIEEMQKEGFQIKKASEIYRTSDQGMWSLNHEDSIFNKNLLIDFGEEFKLDSERYLALPYTPSKLIGDNVVKEQFQTKLTSVLTAHDRIGQFNQGIKQPNITKEELMARFRTHRTELQEEVQLFAATGKNGNMGDFSIRLDQSFVGKSSGVVALNPLDIEAYGNKTGSDAHKFLTETYDYALAKFGGDKEKTLAYMNYEPLSRAKFMDKSILNHYADGMFVNTAFSGEEVFKEMGLLSENYLKDSGFKNMDALMSHFETNGIMVNAIRTPSIKQDSTAPAMLYLDKSLKGKVSKTLLEPALARTEDFDGDQPTFSVFKNAKGHDSVTALSKGASDDLVWKDMQANMLARGTGTYQYFHDEAYETLFKDAQKAFKNADFVSLTGDVALDKKVYAEFNVAPTSEGIMKNSETLEKLQDMYQGQFGERFNLTKEKDLVRVSDIIDTMGDERETYLKAAVFDQAFSKTETGAMAKVRKTAIGEINNPLARLRRTADLALPKFGPDSEKRMVLQNAFADIEQEVISAKKGSMKDYPDKIATFKTALNNLTSGDTQRKYEGKQSMIAWLDKNMDGDFQKSFAHLEKMNKTGGIDKSEAFTYVRDTFVDTIGSFDSQELQKLKQYDILGSNIRSFGLMPNSGDLLKYIPEDRSNFKNLGVNLINDADLLDAQVLSSQKIQAKAAISMHGVSEGVLRDGNFLDEAPLKDGIRKGLSEMGQSLRKGIAELSGSKLGLASVGLAAAYMITGFIGNNASQPADLQAQQMMQGNQEEPQLSDYGTSYQSSSPSNNGYVINVKGGGSPQTLTRARQSIAQTMGNTIDGNINVRMNIMESNGNINDRYIDELLVNAIGR